MQNKIAVIDLGTNTFHLLIVEVSADGFSTLYRERRFIKLAEEGIERIGAAAYARGLDAMLSYRKQLDIFQVKKVRAFGTAALRTAGNGADFMREVEEKTGIRIETIDGDREARLIHKGIQLAVPFDQQYKLIMDIGGGSVEFIIANREKVVWAQSYPIGVAVLHRRFHREDPIGAEERQALQRYLDTILSPLREALKQYPCRDLVGASGTFDVLENMLATEKAGSHYALIPVERLEETVNQILGSTLQERLSMDQLPPERADLIVVALVLINRVLHLAGTRQVIVSEYAMKEGMIAEMLPEGHLPPKS